MWPGATPPSSRDCIIRYRMVVFPTRRAPLNTAMRRIPVWSRRLIASIYAERRYGLARSEYTAPLFRQGLPPKNTFRIFAESVSDKRHRLLASCYSEDASLQRNNARILALFPEKELNRIGIQEFRRPMGGSKAVAESWQRRAMARRKPPPGRRRSGRRRNPARGRSAGRSSSAARRRRYPG